MLGQRRHVENVEGTLLSRILEINVVIHWALPRKSILNTLTVHLSIFGLCPQVVVRGDLLKYVALCGGSTVLGHFILNFITNLIDHWGKVVSPFLFIFFVLLSRYYSILWLLTLAIIAKTLVMRNYLDLKWGVSGAVCFSSLVNRYVTVGLSSGCLFVFGFLLAFSFCGRSVIFCKGLVVFIWTWCKFDLLGNIFSLFLWLTRHLV